MQYIRMLTIVLAVFALGLSISFGQTTEDAVKLFKRDPEKGVEMMKDVVAKENSTDNWNILIQMCSKRYDDALESQEAMNKMFGKALGDALKKEGKESDQSIQVTSGEVLSTYKDFINVLKESTLKARSDYGSILLRSYLIDPPRQKNINERALREFSIAEGYFGDKEFEDAAIHYRKAVSIQPDFYKAILYLGDAYWALKQMDSAVKYYRIAQAINPNLFEPYKYLTDALRESLHMEEALQACLDGICIYPDVVMVQKLGQLYDIQNKRLEWHWFPRQWSINTVGKDTSSGPSPTGPWSVYRQAKADVESYCNEDGILRDNPKTKAKYLEVYCWEKMLKSTDKLPRELTFAKQMLDEGFLDCYVLVTMYHIDIYPQFHDLATTNKDRIKTYISKYLVK